MNQSVEIYTDQTVREGLLSYVQYDLDDQVKIFWIKADFGEDRFEHLSELMVKANDKQKFSTVRCDHFGGPCYTLYKGDTVCLWVYDTGKEEFHFLSNDSISAWNTFIHYLFKDREDFEENIDFIKVKGEWTNDEDLLDIFMDKAIVYLRNQEYIK